MCKSILEAYLSLLQARNKGEDNQRVKSFLQKKKEVFNSCSTLVLTCHNRYLDKSYIPEQGMIQDTICSSVAFSVENQK